MFEHCCLIVLKWTILFSSMLEAKCSLSWCTCVLCYNCVCTVQHFELLYKFPLLLLFTTFTFLFRISNTGFLPALSSLRKQFYYSCGRESPIWVVHSGAKQCEERPRTTALAGHRPYHPDFQGERPIQSIVSAAARTTKASDHVNNLAVPKKRLEGPFREAQWPVSVIVLSAFLPLLSSCHLLFSIPFLFSYVSFCSHSGRHLSCPPRYCGLWVSVCDLSPAFQSCKGTA